MTALSARDEVWACDFTSDALTDGRAARVIGVTDEFSRECLVLEAAISYPAARVCRILDAVAEERGGYPSCLRTDNGPEFIARDLAAWCERHGVHHHRITPGRPMENGRVERFNRTVREDVLDFWAFASLRSLNGELAIWRERYNRTHPHQALDGATPESYRDVGGLGTGSASGLPLRPPPSRGPRRTLRYT